MLFALLGGRPLHADALGSVPTSYLPTGGLVDFLDARVHDPSARRAVRRGDHFPLPRLVRETIADLKLPWKDLACTWCFLLSLLFRAGSSHLRCPSSPPEHWVILHARV